MTSTMRFPTRIFTSLAQKSALTSTPIRQDLHPNRSIHVAPTSGHGLLSPHPHPHPHAAKLPSDSYMYEIFAGVVVGTCGVLGYLVGKWRSAELRSGPNFE